MTTIDDDYKIPDTPIGGMDATAAPPQAKVYTEPEANYAERDEIVHLFYV